MPTEFAWPNGNRIAVMVTLLFENWTDGQAPNYSPMTTSLKPGTYDRAGVTWQQYGGNAGIWRLMRILEQKGHVRHHEDGPRYVFEPVVPRAAERKSALKHLVRTFFSGSITDAVQALIDTSDSKLSKAELDELARRIAAARKEGR